MKPIQSTTPTVDTIGEHLFQSCRLVLNDFTNDVLSKVGGIDFDATNEGWSSYLDSFIPVFFRDFLRDRGDGSDSYQIIHYFRDDVTKLDLAPIFEGDMYPSTDARIRLEIEDKLIQCTIDIQRQALNNRLERYRKRNEEILTTCKYILKLPESKVIKAKYYLLKEGQEQVNQSVINDYIPASDENFDENQYINSVAALADFVFYVALLSRHVEVFQSLLNEFRSPSKPESNTNTPTTVSLPHPIASNQYGEFMEPTLTPILDKLDEDLHLFLNIIVQIKDVIENSTQNANEFASVFDGYFAHSDSGEKSPLERFGDAVWDIPGPLEIRTILRQEIVTALHKFKRDGEDLTFRQNLKYCVITLNDIHVLLSELLTKISAISDELSHEIELLNDDEILSDEDTQKMLALASLQNFILPASHLNLIVPMLFDLLSYFVHDPNMMPLKQPQPVKEKEVEDTSVRLLLAKQSGLLDGTFYTTVKESGKRNKILSIILGSSIGTITSQLNALTNDSRSEKNPRMMERQVKKANELIENEDLGLALIKFKKDE